MDLASVGRHFQWYPACLMLVKALITMKSGGRRLDPDFRRLAHAATVGERLWLERLSPSALAARTADAGGAMRSLPGSLSTTVTKARGDGLSIQFVHRNLEHFVREMDRSSNRLSFAIVIAALIVGSSLVIDVSGSGAWARTCSDGWDSSLSVRWGSGWRSGSSVRENCDAVR